MVTPRSPRAAVDGEVRRRSNKHRHVSFAEVFRVYGRPSLAALCDAFEENTTSIGGFACT